jgi:hypothetical protein
MLKLKGRIPKHVKHNRAIFEIGQSRELCTKRLNVGGRGHPARLCEVDDGSTL